MLAGVAGMGWLLSRVVVAVTAMVTVPKPAAFDLAAVLVTVTLPSLASQSEGDKQKISEPPAAGAALLFAK